MSLRQRILWCIRRIESIFLSIPFVFVYQSPDCNSIPNSTNRFKWLRWCRSCRCTLILLLLLLSFSISFLLFYRLIWLKVMYHHSMGLLNHIILCNLAFSKSHHFILFQVLIYHMNFYNFITNTQINFSFIVSNQIILNFLLQKHRKYSTTKSIWVPVKILTFLIFIIINGSVLNYYILIMI